MHIHWTVEVVSGLSRGRPVLPSAPAERVLGSWYFGRYAAEEKSVLLANQSQFISGIRFIERKIYHQYLCKHGESLFKVADQVVAVFKTDTEADDGFFRIP